MPPKPNTWRPAYYVLLLDECTTCAGTGIFTNTNPMNNSVRRTRCPDCMGAGTKAERKAPLVEALHSLGVKTK